MIHSVIWLRSVLNWLQTITQACHVIDSKITIIQKGTIGHECKFPTEPGNNQYINNSRYPTSVILDENEYARSTID